MMGNALLLRRRISVAKLESKRNTWLKDDAGEATEKEGQAAPAWLG